MRFMQIFVGFVERGLKRQWVAPKLHFFVILVTISLEPLKVRPVLLHSDMKYFIGFLMTLK